MIILYINYIQMTDKIQVSTKKNYNNYISTIKVYD